MESALKIYSLGIVTENKPDGVDIIMVSPIESLNIQAPGSVKDQSTKFEGTMGNTDGKNFKSEMGAKNFLKAKWLSLGVSNRMTAPDVVANESVLIWKYDNVDEYYWTTLFREVGLRRQETVLYAFSNLKSGMTPFDKSTSYWMEVSTKNKSVKLHTAANDGELTEYDIIIDTKVGKVSISDKMNNYISMDSKAGTVSAQATKEILLKAPKITLDGAVEITKGLSNKGNSSCDGSSHSKGSLTTDGNMNTKGQVTDGGGNTLSRKQDK